MVNLEDIIITIVVSTLTTLVALAMPKFLKWLGFRTRRLRWKSYVPKEFPNRDIILGLKPHIKAKVLGEEYEIYGLVMVTSGGEKWFEFTLKAENTERWLEFSEDGITLWGHWLDRELWGELGPRRKWPSPMMARGLESLTEPILEIDGLKAKVIDVGFTREVETLWGRWTSDSPVFRKIDYKCVDAIAVSNEGDEMHINDRRMHINLEAFGGQAVFNDFSVGVELKPKDIRYHKTNT
jgi:hypothetical protein